MRFTRFGVLLFSLVVGTSCGSVSADLDGGSDASSDASRDCDAKLVFQSGDDIFTANPDGSGITNLTNGSGVSSRPSWSPDGTKIAFISDLGGESAVYVQNADGSSSPIQVSETGEIPNSLGWVPMSSQVSFLAQVEGEGTSLIIVTDQATGRQIVSPNPTSVGILAWEPNGSRVVYTNNSLRPVIVDKAGSNDRVLGTVAGVATDWSPDGLKIAYMGSGEIYTISPDGTSNANLSSNSAASSAEAYWLDNERLAFVRTVNGEGDVLTMNADGTDQTNITNSAEDESSISVGPGGSRLTFVRELANGDSRIGVVRSDGSAEIMIDTLMSAIRPRWSPCL